MAAQVKSILNNNLLLPQAHVQSVFRLLSLRIIVFFWLYFRKIAVRYRRFDCARAVDHIHTSEAWWFVLFWSHSRLKFTMPPFPVKPCFRLKPNTALFFPKKEKKNHKIMVIFKCFRLLFGSILSSIWKKFAPVRHVNEKAVVSSWTHEELFSLCFLGKCHFSCKVESSRRMTLWINEWEASPVWPVWHFSLFCYMMVSLSKVMIAGWYLVYSWCGLFYFLI